MSSRERWTVYPLLLLAIGMGLRSGFMEKYKESIVETEFVKCKLLEIVDPAGKPAILLEPQSMTMFSVAGKQRVALKAGNDSSVLTLLDEDPKAALVFDNDGNPKIFERIFPRGNRKAQTRQVWFVEPMDLLPGSNSKQRTPPNTPPRRPVKPAPPAETEASSD